MEHILKVLKDSFNIDSPLLSSMEGYDSTNYKIVTGKGTFVLKMYQKKPETIAILKAEHKILNSLGHLGNCGFPSDILSNGGDYLVYSENYIYRLLSYVEGSFLGEVEQTSDLLYSFGRFLGTMDTVIFQKHHTAISAKESQWDLKHLKKNQKLLNFIPDPKDRNLVDYFFMQFDERVIPYQYILRKGIIHSDANDWNVLTSNGKISGIIDFGDMCHSWLANELAIAVTYVMMGKESPLASTIPIIKGYQETFPLEEQELDLLYYLIAARLCISVCNSAYSKTLKPKSDYITISEKPAWDLLRKWIRINPIKAKDTFRAAAGFPISTKTVLETQLSRRKAHMGSALSLSYSKPIEMAQSAFQYMYDSDGNTFLDAYNNIMLAGHCHPKVVLAGQKTMARLNTNTRYIYEDLLGYSDKLLSKFPPQLDKVFFVNSGSAASDLAIRMAMAHTKKKKIMVLEHGYHGNTRIDIDISHYKYSKNPGLGKQDYIIDTPVPKVFNSGFKNEALAAKHFASIAMGQIKESMGIAAFLAEPIVGCGGQVPLAKGYLQYIYPKIRAQGGICISDEVQVGFGRLGDFFWGYEMLGVVPDMVILGKPMGNGHPIGAVVTTSEIAASFDNGVEFFSSFGGNPVSCSIGNAVLEVIEEENLQKHAKDVGNHLIGLLKGLQNNYPEIADIRGSGLFLGVELLDKKGGPNTKLAAELKNGLREKHILIGTDGPYDSVLKIKPPLSFSKANVEELVYEIRSILEISSKI